MLFSQLECDLLDGKDSVGDFCTWHLVAANQRKGQRVEEREGVRDVRRKECDENNSSNFGRSDLSMCKSLWTVREFHDIPLKVYT